MPTIELDPPSGPPGSHVEITGSGFTDPMWQGGPQQVWLIRQVSDECELVVGLEDPQFELSADGELSGSGKIGTVAGCKQIDGVQPIAFGTYFVSYQCYACTVGEFTITEPTTTTTTASLPRTGPREDALRNLAVAGVALVFAGTLLIAIGQRPHDS